MKNTSNELYDQGKILWHSKPEKILVADYAMGYPVRKETGWEIVPWDKNTDMGSFAKKAAEHLLGIDEHTYPIDILRFANYLRRAYVLEALNLPTDPESLNIVHGIENILSKRKESVFFTSQEIIEEVANFALNLQEKVCQGSPEEMEVILKGKKAYYMDPDGKGALPLEFPDEEYENES